MTTTQTTVTLTLTDSEIDTIRAALAALAEQADSEKHYARLNGDTALQTALTQQVRSARHLARRIRKG